MRLSEHDIEAVFNAAVAKATEAERAAFLDGACAGNADLRDRVEALIDAHERAGTFLRDPALGELPTLDHPAVERPGTRIGPYKLLQVIGEGGFGAVYMAEQERPVRRKVALKIIKLGMDTKQVIARFEAERQALAMMDHPNIARVLDAGATATGRPYFVMELVRGIPIGEYCDKNRLSTRERLDLFIEVCQAVQHAHQKGIIHRDIKPSNVLVTLHDSRPVPKVIDFGIAKATSHRLTEKTLFTEFRQFIGTPEYMSPDQAEISGLDVDTRSDIYSLGVLLYELLTGTTPFDATTLRTAGYGEIQRIIREEEPPKPSTRLVTLADSGTAAARLRHTDARTLGRALRGDLDWIVMKAMEKDRTRRYQTASELADDIRRHLDDEPVTAGAPSVGYKVAKFVRRHRYSVLAATIILATALAGLSAASVGFVRASREAARTRAVNDFLREMTTQLQLGSDERHRSAGEIIARGRALFGDDHAVIGTLLMSRASSLGTAGRLEEAIDAQREALDLFRRAGAGDQPHTAAALSALAKLLTERREYVEAEQVRREALEMTRAIHGDVSEQTADELSALASLLIHTGDVNRNDEIKTVWLETAATYERALGPDHRKTLVEKCQLGKWLHEHGYREAAEPVLIEAVEQSRGVLGNDMNRFVALNALAQLRYIKGDFAGVSSLVDEMLVIVEQDWGRGSTPWCNLVVQQIAFMHRAEDDQTVRQRLAEYLSVRREVPTASCDMMQLTLEEQLFRNLKEWLGENRDLGRDFLFIMLDDVRIVVGRDDERYAKSLLEVSEWLLGHDFDAESEPLLVEAVGLLRGAEPLDKAQLGYALVMLGARRLALGRPAEAEPDLRESLALRREALEEGSWMIGSAQSILGECLLDLRRFEEAEPLLVEGYTVMRADPQTPAESTREALDRLVALYEEWGRPGQADEYLKIKRAAD